MKCVKCKKQIFLQSNQIYVKLILLLTLLTAQFWLLGDPNHKPARTPLCPDTHTPPLKHRVHRAQLPCVCVYLQRDIPGHVDVVLVVVHPHLSHPQGVSAHAGGQVLRVGFVGTLDVGDPGAGQNLHAAATLPHLLG